MTSIFGFEQPDQSAPTGGYAMPEGIPQPDVYTEKEKALRDLFVAQYLIDYDQVRAAQRCGFNFQMAQEYAHKFMAEPYVQLRISEVGIGKNNDEPATLDYDKKRIREMLMKEANNYGPGSSHAARVASLKALMELNGMVKKDTGKSGPASKGGVMQVPAIADLDEWEQAASQSQDALAEHAKSGA